MAAERASDEKIEEMERCLVELSAMIEAKDLKRIVEIDSRFHEILYSSSRNERLSQLLSLLRVQSHRFRTRTMTHPSGMRVAWKAPPHY